MLRKRTKASKQLEVSLEYNHQSLDSFNSGKGGQVNSSTNNSFIKQQ